MFSRSNESSIMRNLILAPVFVLFSGAILAQQASTVTRIELNPGRTQAAEAWLASRAIPLKSLEAGAGFEDLKPLKSVLRNVRILGLGEASHGQREFFQFKHRMLEFLVTQMGFTAFSLEASYPACMKINEYVVDGTGDPKAALKNQGFDQFDTREVLEMIEWMRSYNSKLPEAKRIKFLGYDMQVQYQYAHEALSAYFKKVAPEHVAELDAAYAPLKIVKNNLAIVPQSPDEQARSFARLNQLRSFLLANRDKFVKQTSQWDFDVMLLHARVLEQVPRVRIKMNSAVMKATEKKVPVYSLPEFVEAAALRDVYMAENAETQLKMLGPKGRLIVGGHNGHVQLGPWGEGIPDLTGLKIPAMGGFLRKKLGDAYYALGFDFDRGSFQALGTGEDGKWGLQVFAMPPASEGSLAWHLRTASQGKSFQNYLVNLRDAPKTGPVAEWLSSPLGIVMLTGAYSKDRKRESSQAYISLKDYFDGMLFVSETTRARPVVK